MGNHLLRRRPTPGGLALAIATLFSLQIAGCAVGPDYARPRVAQPEKLLANANLSTASAAVAAGDSQRFVLTGDIQSDWWTLFKSPAINSLIEKAFAANPNLEAAQAALRVAQANVSAQQGFFFPTAALNYTPSRTKLAGNVAGANAPGWQGNGKNITPSANAAPVTYTFHTAQLSVGFVPDVFGANVRAVESLQAQAEAQRFALQAAYVTLATNIVAASVQDALLRSQMATTQELINSSGVLFDLTQRQYKAGFASQLDLANQENALAQAKALMPPLQKQFDQNRNLLRALIGATPDAEIPSFDLNTLQLPQELPLSLPSQLIEQRPDVRAAEALLQAASAQVGIARAARLPSFSIAASVGGTASRFDQMFWNSGRFFDAALGIAQPVFQGGTLLNREKAAREALAQAQAQYQATVITAYENVADALQAIYTNAESLKANHDAAQASKTALDLIRRQHTNGYLDRLALIAAEQSYRQSLLNLSQAQATRLGDTALLFQALGGGWWHVASANTAPSATSAPSTAQPAAAAKANSGDTASYSQPAAIPPKEPPKP